MLDCYSTSLSYAPKTFVTYIRGQNIFRSFDILPQVKRSVIISNKNCIYELHDELPNGNLGS